MSTLAIFGVCIAVAAVAFFIGYSIARKRNLVRQDGKRLEEYSFYPFKANEKGQVEFNISLFNKGVTYFLENQEQLGAQQLIIIGEQNLVRDILTSESLTRYKNFYQKYNGASVISDNTQYLENYKRIVQLVGKSFPGTGIEILLHNLVNPSKSVIAIENGEVTGRRIENGTTNLVLDLKTRKLQNQDKLNYALKIGARDFKCTTIPIFRRDYGLVGAICINVDVNFLKEEVLSSHYKVAAFIEKLVKTDFNLEENILSKSEYQKALEGKRHFMDDALHKEQKGSHNRQLLAILFSDIVGFRKIMGDNEQDAIAILDENRLLHHKTISAHRGTLLKEMGDGVLASFQSASDAVTCGQALLKASESMGKYQLRIGIHIGEVVNAGNDIFGDGVNIASRIHEVASPGAMCISADVYNNVKNKIRFKSQEIGPHQFKHIEHEVFLHEVLL